MKKQNDGLITKRRTFIYFSHRILIMSNIKLTKEQKEYVFKTVCQNARYPFYGYERVVTRKIYYELRDSVSMVEFRRSKIGYLIKILI